MFRNKIVFLLSGLLLLLSACAPEASPEPTLTPTTKPTTTYTPTATNYPLPTETPIGTLDNSPTTTPTITSTITPQPKNDPGLIITLGRKISSPWYPGIPLFSPDGNFIALATTPRIRLWNTHTYQLFLELENPYSEKCYVRNASFSDDGDYFAVSITGCWTRLTEHVQESVPPGHLLVWDLSTGSLIHEWDQEYAYMVDSSQGEFSIPVYAMTFLPNSTKLAYATGNSIAIRDVKDIDGDPEYLSLGHKMYATEISVRDDSQYLFVLMEWDKWHRYLSNYGIEYRLQSWHIDPNYLNITRGYSEVDPGDERMSIHKDNLLHYDFINGTIEVRNLTTNAISQFPNLTGWRGRKYFNSDLSLMIDACLVYCYDDEERLDLWNTDTWKILYSFLPDFGPSWKFGMHNIVFSPDNTILAIAHNEQISLWNINSIVNPNFDP